MKKNYIGILGVIVTGLLMAACNPQIEKKKDLPAPSQATFDTVSTDPMRNSWIVTNTTPGAYVTYWKAVNSKGVVQNTSHNVVDTMFFAYAGTYYITLQTASLGGVTAHTDTVNVLKDSPFAANFDITPVDQWHYTVTVTTPTPKRIWWVLPTGDTMSSVTATFYWPWSGTANIQLTTKASNNGVSTITKPITIASDDPNNPYLNNRVFNLLTGGVDATKGKTWILNPTPYHAAVQPKSDTNTFYYHYDKGLGGTGWTNGALKSTYTFVLRNYQYIPSSTSISASGLYAREFFGTSNILYDNADLVDPKHVQATYIPNHDASNIGTGYGFTVTNGSYVEYFENRYKYFIMRISPDTLYLGHTFNDDTTGKPQDDPNARYFQFYAKK